MKIFKFIYRVEAKSKAQAIEKFRNNIISAQTDGFFEEVFEVEEVETQSAMEKAMENFDLPLYRRRLYDKLQKS